jgi:zeaxanthin glucosyltransferase
MSAVARQLQSRNHDVVMLSLSFIGPLAAANLPFIPFGENEFPTDKAGELLSTLSEPQGEEALQFSVGALTRIAEVRWRELPKLLSANGIDVLVLDNYDFYCEVVPLYLGMPYAILSNALHFDYSGYTPLCVYGCVYGWGHENTPEARQRNRQGVSKFTQNSKPKRQEH